MLIPSQSIGGVNFQLFDEETARRINEEGIHFSKKIRLEYGQLSLSTTRGLISLSEFVRRAYPSYSPREEKFPIKNYLSILRDESAGTMGMIRERFPDNFDLPLAQAQTLRTACLCFYKDHGKLDDPRVSSSIVDALLRAEKLYLEALVLLGRRTDLSQEFRQAHTAEFGARILGLRYQIARVRETGPPEEGIIYSIVSLEEDPHFNAQMERFASFAKTCREGEAFFQELVSGKVQGSKERAVFLDRRSAGQALLHYLGIKAFFLNDQRRVSEVRAGLEDLELLVLPKREGGLCTSGLRRSLGELETGTVPLYS